ncbi:hypothetical protein ILUMI_04063 [Ignelater luminosus]|uniref:Uncharacterized protein n=1 Tax=Ignelater luminosus TaxID=2038154 RepID=A0A8K0GEX2_IGNLU|nr:hypothetical protein ILUMI_04063 [Ignelater luminosus]
MKKRGQAEARIDSRLFEQLEDERKYWRNVLHRDDAYDSLNKGWNQIIATLEAIKSDPAHQNALVKNETTGLLAQENSLETAILLGFWGSILKQFNIVSKILQAIDTDVEVVSRLYNSLITFVENKRDSFDTFEEAGKKSSQEYRSSHKRVIKRKKRDDEYREGEVLLLGRDHFRVNTFFPICDQLLGKLGMHKTSYDTVTLNFAFLCKLDTMSEAKVIELTP